MLTKVDITVVKKIGDKILGVKSELEWFHVRISSSLPTIFIIERKIGTFIYIAITGKIFR